LGFGKDASEAGPLFQCRFRGGQGHRLGDATVADREKQACCAAAKAVRNGFKIPDIGRKCAHRFLLPGTRKHFVSRMRNKLNER
jgi:hypothetical protein